MSPPPRTVYGNRLNENQSLFGMHLFDTTESGVVAARPKFIITLVVLSASTYVAAGVAYWFVRHKKKIDPAENGKRKPLAGQETVATDGDADVGIGEEKTKRTISGLLRKRKGIWTGKRSEIGKAEGKELNVAVSAV